MPEFTIVCCISDADVYERCLLGSLNALRATADFEIVPIINHGNRWSASNALNIGIQVARADTIVFAHQDVRLLPGWFGKLRSIIAASGDRCGIIGAAGIDLTKGRSNIGRWGGTLTNDIVAVGTIWDSDESLPLPPFWDGICEPTRIHVVDECVFALRRRTGLRFDNQFTGFHFYGVDLCLQARAAGYQVWGGELPVVHYGKYSGSIAEDKRYWHYLRLLHSKWHRRFPEVLGTHMHWADKELTAYIPLRLASHGLEVKIKAQGVAKARFAFDSRQGIVND